MSDSENTYSSKEKKEINEKLHDLTGSKYPEKIRKGPSILKYILGFFVNWIKLPFQLNYIQDSVQLLPEVKKIDPNHLVVKPDHTFAYYSNNTTMDGFNHETHNQFVRHAMYMFLTPMEESIYNAAMKFVYTNIHGGLTLTNGISWKDGSAHYHGDNVTTETLALMTLMAPYSDALRVKFEKLVLNIVDNGGYLNYLSNPGGKKSKAYEKALEKAMYVRENVQMENPATNMFPGCSADSAVVMLAALAVATKSSGNRRLKRLFNLYYYLFGYGLKARFCSNSLEAITALYVLYKVTKDNKYGDILKKKLDSKRLSDLDSDFKRFLYGHLIGAQ